MRKQIIGKQNIIYNFHSISRNVAKYERFDHKVVLGY